MITCPNRKTGRTAYIDHILLYTALKRFYHYPTLKILLVIRVLVLVFPDRPSVNRGNKLVIACTQSTASTRRNIHTHNTRRNPHTQYVSIIGNKRRSTDRNTYYRCNRNKKRYEVVLVYTIHNTQYTMTRSYDTKDEHVCNCKTTAHTPHTL